MKPIIFNTEMVQAILNGRKTQTRRPVKYKFLNGYNPEWTGYKPAFEYGNFFLYGSNGEPATTLVKPPYQKGDILYVRETCYLYGYWTKNGITKTGKQKYKFVWDKSMPAKYLDSPPDIICNRKTQTGYFIRPSIHMPKEAARIFLHITDVRVEHVQDITEEQAKAEGCGAFLHSKTSTSARQDYMHLWQQIYDKDEARAWISNPWVWVYEFERVEKPEVTH